MTPISNETIAKNARKFFKVATEKGFMNDELMTFLGSNFIEAPATTMKDMNNAFKGGLIDHILKVTTYAIGLNDLHKTNKVDATSILKVCFLHQIGKAHSYVPNPSQWHVEKQGKIYEFTDQLSMRVGERSAFYALSHGITLTEEEYQAIVNHDKDDSDKQSKYHNSWLGDLLKIATVMAIAEEKNTKPAVAVAAVAE
jgi:hypothetical protein